ncbi:MAG: calcium/sodium antiporter [Planctomycetia bacterium]|nr:calcium/sodium antiporter [Planctomycetia bacterium]
MDWLSSSGSLVLGIFMLMIAGDKLISAAVNLGLRWRVSPLFIGTTVVAAGTSFPELVVAILAQIEESSGLTIGNVIGSNIFNIGVVLGVVFIWKHQKGLVGGKAESYVLSLLTFIFLGTLYWAISDNSISILTIQHGLFLLTLFILVMILNYKRGRSQSVNSDLEEFIDSETSRWTYLSLFVSMIGLWIGAEFLVHGASELARLLGANETTIGLTVVAAGTGAPELFACISALRKGSSQIALGNILGSNIFNTLGIVGAATLIAPLPMDTELLRIDLWVMTGLTMSLLLLQGVLKGKFALRTYGIVLLLVYSAWLLEGVI